MTKPLSWTCVKITDLEVVLAWKKFLFHCPGKHVFGMIFNWRFLSKQCELEKKAYNIMLWHSLILCNFICSTSRKQHLLGHRNLVLGSRLLGCDKHFFALIIEAVIWGMFWSGWNMWSEVYTFRKMSVVLKFHGYCQ